MLTCGLFRYLPFLSASAICPLAAVVVRPATLICPMSGIRIAPFSSTRVSVVRSGCWNTVTRTASPTPSFSNATVAFSPDGTALSAGAAALSVDCAVDFAAGCAAVAAGGAAFAPGCAFQDAQPVKPATAHSNIPNRTCLIAPRLDFVTVLKLPSSPFDLPYVFDARAFAQLAEFRRGELHALARRQELADHRRGLLLGERRFLGVHELHHRDAGRRGEHCDLAVFHARKLGQLREWHLLGRLRHAQVRIAHAAAAQPRRHLLEVAAARRPGAQRLGKLGHGLERELAQAVDAPLGEQGRIV